MGNTKHFVIIGLGSFGAAVAERLAQNGCRVTGIDASRERVESLKERLYEVVIGDARQREALKHLPLADANAVVVSLGEDIAQSLLVALHAKELGARRIIVKGVNEDHGKILKSLGVERVVFPEVEIGRGLADRLTWPNVLDFLPIDPDYSLVEITVPDSLIGKTLGQLDVRKQLGVWVVGVKDVMTTHLEMFPDGDFKFEVDQMLLVVGKQPDLDRLREMR
ncbi:MAG: hypothetical protein A2W31_03145 [Planctomycetes bacterium RBG_16_64_10]|nr:MAG: hypothetical protein A2W31_03145 [Planctomycetes bacterium RBG_16_64_10]